MEDLSLKDTKRGSEALGQASVRLQAINKCGLPGKNKGWYLQFMLIPKLLWPLLVHEISTSTVDHRSQNKQVYKKITRGWSHLDVAMYCGKAKLRLPLKSIVEKLD
ncbi:reverse transcriptase [Plakobranchus ocellatus]|uniref:Reverse transcriptase n=1 Tax=Plakobranchus ocellatus TaxID=259542 RepID=A0AAV4AY51_9GAST|nr:reverse transcriptase [Plakobranchus ocellatus]